MLGEDGDDTITADDSEADTIDGGNGNDSGTFDSTDDLTSIENPTIVGNPPPPPG